MNTAEAANTVAARINADTAAALRRMCARIDDGDREYDGYGAPISDLGAGNGNG